MREVTETDERALSLRAWICDQCKIERTTTAGEDDPPRDDCGSAAVAGSEERIRAYRRRVAQGKAVFHPADNSTLTPPRTRTGKQNGNDPCLKGVRRRRQGWEARVPDGAGRYHSVGHFATQQEAIAARDAALARQGPGAGDEAA